MTPEEATAFAGRLPTVVGGCELRPYVPGTHGFTAVVVECFRDGRRFAIKIHHPPTIELTGGLDALRQRLDRQARVQQNPHDGIVRIFETGYDDSNDLYYVLMEYVDAPPLRDVRARIPPASQRKLIADIARAALHLEGLGLVHRDIKPGNVGIATDFGSAKLLDLGVLRPIGVSDITVPLNLNPFVATTRYSPPEFLANVNQDTTDGWRAITFYQLGALVFEIITGKQLFAGIPDERLRDAVLTNCPSVDAPSADSDLVYLARHCLEKDPELRLKLVRWDDFLRPAPTSIAAAVATAQALLQREDAGRPRPTWTAETAVAYRASRCIAQLSNVIRRATSRHADLLAPRELHSETGPSLLSLCSIVLTIPSKSQRPLPEALVVEFRAGMLDETSETIQLQAQASWRIRATWADAIEVFRGGLETSELQEAVERALLSVITNAIGKRTRRSEAGIEYVLLELGS